MSKNTKRLMNLGKITCCGASVNVNIEFVHEGNYNKEVARKLFVVKHVLRKHLSIFNNDSWFSGSDLDIDTKDYIDKHIKSL